MFEDLVGLDAYEGSLPNAQEGDIRELAKALRAGSDINNPGAASGLGFPLRIESLESVLKVVTVQDKADFAWWSTIPKSPAFNTVEEFNRLTSVGHEDGIFISEGALPEEDDDTFERAYTLIRYMATLRRVTHPMLLVKRAIPDGVLAQQAKSGTLKLLRGIERALWDGDATLSGVQFDGFFRQFIDGLAGRATGASQAGGSLAWHGDVTTATATGLLQDMRNQPILQDDTGEIQTIIAKRPNHGRATDVYMPFESSLDFSRQWYPKERTESLITDGIAGTVIRGFQSIIGGTVKLRPSKYLELSTTADQTGTGNAVKRPNAPVIVSILTPVVGAGNAPGFGGTVQGRTAAAAVDGTGNYYFQVVACNSFGKSAPVSSGAIAVLAGDRADIMVTDGSPAGTTEWYEIYRTYPGAAAATEAGFIFRASRTAATQTIADLNRFLPYTARAYWIQRNKDAICWKQLLPLLKVNLAQIDLTVRFALVIYGGMSLFAYRKHGVSINVGRLV